MTATGDELARRAAELLADLRRHAVDHGDEAHAIRLAITAALRTWDPAVSLTEQALEPCGRVTTR